MTKISFEDSTVTVMESLMFEMARVKTDEIPCG